MNPPSLNYDHQISTTLNQQSGKSRPSWDMTVHQAQPNEAFLRRNWVQYPLSVPQMLISECQPIRDLWLQSDFQVHLVGTVTCTSPPSVCLAIVLPRHLFCPSSAGPSIRAGPGLTSWDDEAFARLRNVVDLGHRRPTDPVSDGSGCCRITFYSGTIRWMKGWIPGMIWKGDPGVKRDYLD